jgi:WD40 repeat protein
VEQCARSSRWNLSSSKDIAADFAFLDDARLVTLSGFEIAVVDPKRYTPVQSFPLEGVGRLSMCLARDGVVLGDRQGGIELRDLETFSLKGAWRDTDQQSVNWLGFAPNHHLVFARTDQGMVVLSYPNMERVEGYPSEWCNALTLSIDGERFARADAPQNTVSVWNTHPPTRLMTFTGYGDAIHCLAFSPDGRYVVSGDGERLIRAWDLESGKEVRRLSGHRGRVDCVVFSADSRTLISQCREYGTIKFWNLETGRELASISDRIVENLPMRRLALSPSGNLLAFREKESKVGILDLSPVAQTTPADK